nr:MAG TPA: hypothetical protein [Caudoviricetes sp.]
MIFSHPLIFLISLLYSLISPPNTTLSVVNSQKK